MALSDILSNAETAQNAAIKTLNSDLRGIYDGRGGLHLLEGVKVEYYGTPTPVMQVASCSSASQELQIRSRDKSLEQPIATAIQRATGLQAHIGDSMIRVPMRPLTDSGRRAALQKVAAAAATAEESVRAARRAAVDQAGDLVKSGELSEDGLNSAVNQIEQLSTQHLAEVATARQTKEKQLNQV